jgi:DNA primase
MAQRFLSTYEVVKESVDLPSFMEGDLGIDIQWSSDRESCKCICPFHGDSDPSFSMRKHADGWGFHCFGCNSGGTVVEFFMKHYNLEREEALEQICERFEIGTDSQELLSAAIRALSRDVNTSGRLASMHRLAADECRTLLRSRVEDAALRKWVSNAFRRMNECLEDMDCDGLERICTEARRLK